jgi:hypothetical protein
MLDGKKSRIHYDQRDDYNCVYGPNKKFQYQEPVNLTLRPLRISAFSALKKFLTRRHAESPQSKSRTLKFAKQVQRKEQSYSECHGPETPNNTKNQIDCMDKLNVQ